MNNTLAAAVGIVFTLSVCMYVAYALLGPWFRVRRASLADAEQLPEKRNAPSTETAPAHSI